MKLLSRIASHAGGWYPESAEELSAAIKKSLLQASKNTTTSLLKSVIVPHAGYRFCMDTIAYSFAQVDPTKYNRVVVIGPSHHEYFQGCGLTSFTTLETPLGSMKVDIDANYKLLKNKIFFKLQHEIDIEEHSIEMELPFIKHVFGEKDIKIVPIMVGELSYNDIQDVAEYMKSYFIDNETLFVISSDFCHWGKRFHFINYNKDDGEVWKSIQKLDLDAVKAIESQKPAEFANYLNKTHNTICGRTAILILLSGIENSGQKWNTTLLNYSQSSKCITMDESSVSYVAAASYKE